MRFGTFEHKVETGLRSWFSVSPVHVLHYAIRNWLRVSNTWNRQQSKAVPSRWQFCKTNSPQQLPHYQRANDLHFMKEPLVGLNSGLNETIWTHNGTWAITWPPGLV